MSSICTRQAKRQSTAKSQGLRTLPLANTCAWRVPRLAALSGIASNSPCCTLIGAHRPTQWLFRPLRSSARRNAPGGLCVKFIGAVSHLLACTAGLPLAAGLYTSPVDGGRILILRYGRALKTGAFFRFGRQTIRIPEGSLASSPTRSVEEREGITAPART